MTMGSLFKNNVVNTGISMRKIFEAAETVGGRWANVFHAAAVNAVKSQRDVAADVSKAKASNVGLHSGWGFYVSSKSDRKARVYVKYRVSQGYGAGGGSSTLSIEDGRGTPPKIWSARGVDGVPDRDMKAGLKYFKSKVGSEILGG